MERLHNPSRVLAVLSKISKSWQLVENGGRIDSALNVTSGMTWTLLAKLENNGKNRPPDSLPPSHFGSLVAMLGVSARRFG